MSMLRTLRERKGLTISQLAAKAGISSRVIIDYEESRQTISLRDAKLLAKALWVGIEELMPPAGAITAQPGMATMPVPRPTPVPTSSPIPQASVTAPVPASSPASLPRSANGEGAAHQYEVPRVVGSVAADASPGRGGVGAAAAARGGARPPKPAPPPPGPITEGQLDELQRLAARLEITTEQLEERVGKKLTDLNRPEAKEWIKRARGMVEEIAPSREVPYGQWPEAREDQEAAYLKSQQEAGSHFNFKLFNGEQFAGVITNFTPYTITIAVDGTGDEMVLRKLAIAYYRRGEAPTTPGEVVPQDAEAAKTTRTRAKSKTKAADAGTGSDRAGEPATPEIDNMDEDRGV